LREKLGETLFKRCHFVVNEIQRVQDAVIAIENSDFKKLGELMSANSYWIIQRIRSKLR
jgi:galactokinase